MTDQPDKTSPKQGAKANEPRPADPVAKKPTDDAVVLPENATDAPVPSSAIGGTVDAAADQDRLTPAGPKATAPATAKPDPVRPAVSGPTIPGAAKPEPVKPEPAKPEPAKSEPVKSEPAKSEPVKPEPIGSEPVRGGLGAGGAAAVVVLGLAAGFGGAYLYQQLVPSPVATRLAALETRIGTPPPQVAALEQRVGRVEGAAQETRSVAEKALAQAGQAAKEAAAPAADPAALEALGKRVGSLEALPARLDALARGDEARTKSIGAIEERLSGLAKTVADSPDAAALRAVIRVSLADRVQDGLRAGRAYDQALAGLSRLGADPARIAALEPFAKGGSAPSAGGPALARDFRAALAKAPAGSGAAAASAPAGEGDWKDRLLGLADKIVTVTPLAPAPARPVGAARVETALERGAFAEALQAWKDLPEASRQASEGVGAALGRRVAAEEAAAALASDAIAAIETAMR